ncbi:MAG: recombinase XerD, partial [Sorangiineae bacterium PRO1]|nr:recombinase XerD [Sorangiineae bacterium PRO1]
MRAMPRRGERKRRPPASAADPNGLWIWARRYVDALRVRNFSERTIESREGYLALFIEWAEARSITRPVEITKPILERYQRHLFHLRKPDGKPLSFRAQSARLVALRAYFRWLARQNVILSNPASDLDMPRLGKRLPRHVLDEGEIEQVLGLPDTSDAFGIRDRAMMETLWSTGMRRSELIRLSVYDIDVERG